MKRNLIFVLFLLLSAAALAQMPKAINYQAVARNAAGQALANQSIKVRLSIISSAAGNPTLYSETRQVTTNALGLFNVQIGGSGALSTSGNFSTINWVNNTTEIKSLKVELDINNSGAFTDMGSQSLVTVPYAFAADAAVNAYNIGGNYVSSQTPNTGDLLKWDGSAWVPAAAPAMPVIYNYNFAMNGTSVPGGTTSFTLLGNNVKLTLTSNQRITAVLNGVVGSSSGTVTQLGVAVCYQALDANDNPTGSVIPFYSNTYPSPYNIENRQMLTVSGTIGNLPAGRYAIGFGVRNPGANALNNNEYCNGFVMVTNN